MLTAHELFGFMSPALASDILEHTFAQEKDLYRATLHAVAAARKVRPVFLEKQSRAQRHPAMIAALGRPAQELAAANLLRSWLVKKHAALLADFLDTLGIAHQQGAVEELPESVDDAKLGAAVDTVLTKHQAEVVIVYLHAFNSMNETSWKNLATMLNSDARLQFGD